MNHFCVLHFHLKVKGKFSNKEETGAGVAEAQQAGEAVVLAFDFQWLPFRAGYLGSFLSLSELTSRSAVPGAGLGTGWAGGRVSPILPVSRTLRMTNKTN